MEPCGLQQAKTPCFSLFSRVCPCSCPLKSVILSSYLILCLPLLLFSSIIPNIRVFPLSWLFTSGGQSIGASASTPIIPMNIQGSFPLGFTDLNSLLSKGLLTVFSMTAIQKHHFFGSQTSLRYNSHIHTWLLERLWLRLYGLLLEK